MGNIILICVVMNLLEINSWKILLWLFRFPVFLTNFCLWCFYYIVLILASVLSQDRTQNEDKIAIGCEDASVIVYDEIKSETYQSSSDVVPYRLKWHPSGSEILVASHRAEFQIFDLALSPLLIQKSTEDFTLSPTFHLGSYFK